MRSLLPLAKSDWHFATDGFIYGACCRGRRAGGVQRRSRSPYPAACSTWTGSRATCCGRASFTSGAVPWRPRGHHRWFLGLDCSGHRAGAGPRATASRSGRGRPWGSTEGALAAAATDVFVAHGGWVVARAGSDGRQVWSRALPGITLAGHGNGGRLAPGHGAASGGPGTRRRSLRWPRQRARSCGPAT